MVILRLHSRHTQVTLRLQELMLALLYHCPHPPLSALPFAVTPQESGEALRDLLLQPGEALQV